MAMKKRIAGKIKGSYLDNTVKKSNDNPTKATKYTEELEEKEKNLNLDNEDEK